jgi:hypothetical protein
MQAEQASRQVLEGTGSAGANRPRAASAADEANGAAAPPSPRMADPDVIRSFDPLHQPPRRPPPPRHPQQGQSQSQNGGPLQARGIDLYCASTVGCFYVYLCKVLTIAVYVK